MENSGPPGFKVPTWEEIADNFVITVENVEELWGWLNSLELGFFDNINGPELQQVLNIVPQVILVCSRIDELPESEMQKALAEFLSGDAFRPDVWMNALYGFYENENDPIVTLLREFGGKLQTEGEGDLSVFGSKLIALGGFLAQYSEAKAMRAKDVA